MKLTLKFRNLIKNNWVLAILVNNVFTRYEISLLKYS